MDCGSFSEETIRMVHGYCSKFYIRDSRCQTLYERMSEIENWNAVEINFEKYKSDLSTVLKERSAPNKRCKEKSIAKRKVERKEKTREEKEKEKKERLPLTYYRQPLFYKNLNPFHKFPSGTGASSSISSFETGWTNLICRAWRQILPSGLERGEPYFKSPLIGHPIFAN